jgi:signal recognition particle receptor subunit beta
MPDVNARILLWGIAGCGKTTTLQTIHDKLRADLRGELRREPTRLDPTIQYEALPISLGDVGGVGTQIEIIAVPGAADQEMTRKQLLDEVDGIVLVLDCSPDRIENNFVAIEELRGSLSAYGRDLEAFPIVLQYNKRDIADPFAIEDLHRRVGLEQAAVFETIATTGHGILATLTTISKHVVRARRGASQEIDPGAAKMPIPSSESRPANETDLDSGDPIGEKRQVEMESIVDELVPDAAHLLEDSPVSEPQEIEAHDILEAAILAEGESEGLGQLSEAVEIDLSEDSSANWASADGSLTKPEAGLGTNLRIVSAGQATVEANGGLRLPLVLGDESGQSRSVILSLRIDELIESGGD